MKLLTVRNGNHFLNFFTFNKPLKCQQKSISGLESYRSFSSASFGPRLLTPSTRTVNQIIHTAFQKTLNFLARALTTTVSLTKRSGLRSFQEKALSFSALVFRGLYVGLAARVQSILQAENRRALIGGVLMLVVAPVSYVIYWFFDREQHVAGWFHYNWFHFFFLLRFQIAAAFWILGSYLYIPASNRTKIFAFALGFVLMSIGLNIMASKNEDIWNIVNWYLFAAGILLSLVIFYGMDFMIYNWSHRIRKVEASWEQLGLVVDDEDFDDAKFRNMFRQNWKTKKQFEKEY